jgi:hypothetical protein
LISLLRTPERKSLVAWNVNTDPLHMKYNYKSFDP